MQKVMFKTRLNYIFCNEIYLDSFWKEKLGFDRGAINYRPLKFKILNKSRILFYLFKLLWPLIILICNLYFFVISFGKRRVNLVASEVFWLDSSNKSRSIISSIKSNNLSIVNMRRHDYFNYLGVFDRLKSISFVFYACFFEIPFFKAKDRFHFVDLYRVMCFSLFIKKIDLIGIKLNMCNHYDRWAMTVYQNFSTGSVVWQHGLLSDDVDLPMRLMNINEVRCINVDEIPRWRRLLDGNPVSMMVQETTFSVDRKLPIVDIMLISHPAYIEEEILFLLDLISIVKHSNLVIGYKLHPVFDYKIANNKLRNTNIIKFGKEEFPPVVLAVTKSSTLGVEYESIGTKVIWHTDETAKSVYESYLKNIN